MSNSCWPHGLQHARLPVHHQLLELAETHVHWGSDAIQPSHPLSSPSPPAFNLFQHQGLFQWISSSIRWPKYWSFSFNISPSNEYSVLISFRMDWLDLLATKELSKVFSNTTIQKHFRAELKVELGPIVYFCIFFLYPWKTELRKYSYNLCLKMFYVLFCELHCLWPYI